MRKVMLNKLLPFKQFNYERLSGDEKQALDSVINELSLPIGEEASGKGKAKTADDYLSKFK
jgi:hypothetical protein